MTATCSNSTVSDLLKAMKIIKDLEREKEEISLFIDFFKNELPDVYKEMWKQYCKSKQDYLPSAKSNERFDSFGNQLMTGESQRKDGRYNYRSVAKGKKTCIYALSLDELRIKEMEVRMDDTR